MFNWELISEWDLHIPMNGLDAKESGRFQFVMKGFWFMDHFIEMREL